MYSQSSLNLVLNLKVLFSSKCPVKRFTALRSLGVKRIRIHDLRHSHISLLIRLGFSAVAIGNRVGHESQTITFHYAHMFPTEQIEMADKLNEEFVPGTGNGGDVQ